ncbi:MAG: c-type heme family protein [Thermodesulfobacteriota bacterium]
MKLLWPFRLQFRFLGMICLVAIAMGLFFVGVLFFHLQNIMTQEAQQRTRLIMEQAQSVRGYVQDVLRPKMFSSMEKDKFIIQAMSSSYVSRKIMGNVADGKDIRYRRVALNSRNSEFEPTQMEKEMIRYFQENPEKDILEKKVQKEKGEYYYSFQPIVFSKRCMRCHGDPKDAPEEIIDKYGKQGGFYKQPGEIAGVISVGFPMQRAMAMVKGTTISYLFLYLAGIALFFGIVQFYFQKLVSKKLKKLFSVMRQNNPGSRHVNSREVASSRGESSDELEEVITGLENMAGALGQARSELENYAQNLEHMVRDRTAELEREARNRQSDVTLFLNILQTLHSSRDSEGLIKSVVRLVGQRFQAEAISYYCTNFSERVFTWPEFQEPPELPREQFQSLHRGEVVYAQEDLFIPVHSKEQFWGVLHLRISEGAPCLRSSEQVLLALGQQLGVALENMRAFFDLMHSKRLLESIFEGISDPLLLLDKRANILLANQGAKEIFPFDSRAVMELKEILGTCGEEDKSRGMLQMAFQENAPVVQEAILAGDRSFRFSLYPLLSTDDNSPHLIVCYVRENTSEKRMLAKLQRTERLSAVGQLAAGLAHEINNPLGTILCYVRLLRNNLTDSEMLGDLDVIDRQANRAHEIVSEMLDFAKPKTREGESCALNEVVEKYVDLFFVQADKKKVYLCKELEPELFRIRADESAVEQILSNLLLNALDAAGEGGWVKVGTYCCPENNQAYLEVWDSGPGIPEEKQHQVFDPFYSTKDTGGTGLGLTVVYGLVQELNADIEVTNDQGAKFSIVFQIGENVCRKKYAS